MRFKNTALYFLAILFFAFSYRVAYAVTINFDDLEEIISEEGYLTTEYEHQGVIFEPYAFPALGENSSQALSGPWVTFSFVGKLPTYVSFVLNHPDELAIGVSATGPNGYWETILTKGGVIGMSGEEMSTPYVPNQMIEMASEFGISSVRVEENHLYFLLDDLTFHYATQSVPEPHIGMLLILALALVFYRHITLKW